MPKLMPKLNFITDFNPEYGRAVKISNNITRITCNNPSPFTFFGTNTYIIGKKILAIIDPGPNDKQHLAAILQAIDGRPISHIFITHTHADHSPLAKPLQKLTNAPTFAKDRHPKEKNNPLEASADYDFFPDKKIKHNEKIIGDDWQLLALHTPGHTQNHMAFALNNTPYLFSGDHVMAWATTIIAPPEGSMAQYMNSLELLLKQKQTIYLSGHGAELKNAHAFIKKLKAHRIAREHAILQQIKNGTNNIEEIVLTLYKDINKNLHKAAALSITAHLQHLMEKKKIVKKNNKFYPL